MIEGNKGQGYKLAKYDALTAHLKQRMDQLLTARVLGPTQGGWWTASTCGVGS
jgi:hypothetical protein